MRFWCWSLTFALLVVVEEEEEEEEDLFVFNDTIESHFCAFGVGVTLLVVHLLCTYRQHISNTLATHWQHISNTLATHHISNTLATHHIGNTLATHHISNTLAPHFLRCTPCFFRVNQASFFGLGSPEEQKMSLGSPEALSCTDSFSLFSFFGLGS